MNACIECTVGTMPYESSFNAFDEWGVSRMPSQCEPLQMGIGIDDEGAGFQDWTDDGNKSERNTLEKEFTLRSVHRFCQLSILVL